MRLVIAALLLLSALSGCSEGETSEPQAADAVLRIHEVVREVDSADVEPSSKSNAIVGSDGDFVEIGPVRLTEAEVESAEPQRFGSGWAVEVEFTEAGGTKFGAPNRDASCSGAPAQARALIVAAEGLSLPSP